MGGMVNLRVLALGLLAAMLAACASDPGPLYGTEPSISIPYDPYDFDPDDLQAEADAHCNAYDLNAVYDGETIDNKSVRWRYRHYRCI
ncbi:MAG: hypothetical protein DHS20C04_23170 [Hyphococcus sp.]|nr:MAG: hypothetical protein DHS20C04_23170 [Marinicaulis sp.]